MTGRVAALPMYDWPEARAETDRWWEVLRDRLRRDGIDAPQRLARRKADLPPGEAVARAVPLAVSTASAEDDEALELGALWRHPALLFAQTCWGPMEEGLSSHVQVIGQPDYSAFEGGSGELYSSAILMRADAPGIRESKAGGAPGERAARLPPRDLMRGRRLAFNSTDSMSGLLALSRDLDASGESLSIFCTRIPTGSHRASIAAVAKNRADLCAVDCRTWDLARRFEPLAAELKVVGWTAKRRGLPFITARATDPATVNILRSALQELSLASSG